MDLSHLAKEKIEKSVENKIKDNIDKKAEVSKNIGLKKLENKLNPDAKADISKKSELGEKRNQNPDIKAETSKKSTTEVHKKEIPERMEPPVVIKFKCPDGCDPKEFDRQLKGQERGLNSQTIKENVENREKYNQRKQETGNGRDPEGRRAQDLARQKAYYSRIESNQKNGMSYQEAKKEADSWISTQAALHNPDQIAGGDAKHVSRMGDASVNSSIGSQWRNGGRVDKLDQSIKEYSKDKSPDELATTKLNVRLERE